MKYLQKLAALIVVVLIGCSVCSMAADVPDELPDPDGEPADMSKKVKVFILMGQSNMLGFGKISGGEKSLEHAVKVEKKYPYLIDDDGNWTVRKDVRNVRVMCSGSGPSKTHKNEWLTISGRNIGPEIGIGHYVGEVLEAPVLILKSCIGNRALGWDLLPPSAEGYAGNPEKPRKPKQGVGWYAGVQYDGDVAAAMKVLDDLQTYYPDAKGYEIAGFFFWQGAKDCGKAEWANAYEENLVELIKSLRDDFASPDAPFVCATLGEAKKGSGGNKGKVTAAQLAVDGETGKYPEFKGKVATFYSNPVAKPGGANGHYSRHAQTYMNVGEGMGRAMAELLEENGGASRETSVRPGRYQPPRLPRRLPKENFDKLQGALQATLAKLSSDGELKKVQVKLKRTKHKVWLKEADQDGNLTYQLLSADKTATFQLPKLTRYDHAYLARLVSELRPESEDAKAMAGAFFEAAGNTKLADKFYDEAGGQAKKKFTSLFDE